MDSKVYQVVGWQVVMKKRGDKKESTVGRMFTVRSCADQLAGMCRHQYPGAHVDIKTIEKYGA